MKISSWVIIEGLDRVSDSRPFDSLWKAEGKQELQSVVV